MRIAHIVQNRWKWKPKFFVRSCNMIESCSCQKIPSYTKSGSGQEFTFKNFDKLQYLATSQSFDSSTHIFDDNLPITITVKFGYTKLLSTRYLVCVCVVYRVSMYTLHIFRNFGSLSSLMTNPLEMITEHTCFMFWNYV